MKLISHRGNITGPEPLRENTTEFIQEAIDAGYDVEIDVRIIEDNLFLGHDTPDHPVTLSWLTNRKDNLWIHAKNFSALATLINYDLMVFYHQLEKHTIIGNTKLIWSHNICEASKQSVIPLLGIDDIRQNQGLNMDFHGVCSDYVGEFL